MGNRVHISFDGLCAWILIFLMLFVPMQWTIGWTIAVLIHELGHLAILFIFRVKIHAIYIGAFGTEIETDAMHPIAEAVCAISGPGVGLLAVLLREKIPFAAVSAVIQSAYNLLPVFPLDGGRVVNALMAFFLPHDVAAGISRKISQLAIAVVFICGLFVSTKYHLGFWPVLFPALPLIFIVRKNSLQCRQKNSTIQKIKL